MRITLDVHGDRQLSRELVRFADAATDWRPVLSRIADFVISETGEQFDTEGGHASGGWAPLKPATIRAKAARGLDPRILHAHGFLESSLTQRGDPNMILEVSRDELLFGSRLVYAGAHQNPRPGSPLPQRRPVELTEQARRQIVRMLQVWVRYGGDAT